MRQEVAHYRKMCFTILMKYDTFSTLKDGTDGGKNDFFKSPSSGYFSTFIYEWEYTSIWWSHAHRDCNAKNHEILYQHIDGHLPIIIFISWDYSNFNNFDNRGGMSNIGSSGLRSGYAGDGYI